MFECMSAGLPVVASDFPVWREVVEGNKCGLVVNGRVPAEAAAAITCLLERPELRKEMGENGRKTVEEKYSWESQASLLLGLYSKLTGTSA